MKLFYQRGIDTEKEFFSSRTGRQCINDEPDTANWADFKDQHIVSVF